MIPPHEPDFSDKPDDDPWPPVPPPVMPRRRRWVRWLGWTVMAFGVLVLVGPPLVAHTWLRNVVVNLAFPDPEVEATSGGATFGWLSPLRLQRLGIRHRLRGDSIHIEQIVSDRTLLGLIWQKSDLGKFTIEEPRIDLIASAKGLPTPPEKPAAEGAVRPTFAAHVYRANVTLRTLPTDDPIVDVRDVNLNVDVQRTARGRILAADDVKIFQHTELTEEMCHRGLQLIAPLLANAAAVDGEISLTLHKLRIPLDEDDPARRAAAVEVDGNLQLHRVATGARNPVIRRVLEILTGIIRVQMPEKIRIADNSNVHFHTQDGRVFHEGFAFGLPEISPELQIRTSGSVGLDETLDLRVEIPIPLTLLHDGPLMRRLSERPFELKVGGTLKMPEVMLPEDRAWHEEILGRLLETRPGDPGEASAAEAVIDVVGALLEERRARRENSETPPPPMLERFRNWRKTRRGSTPPPPVENRGREF